MSGPSGNEVDDIVRANPRARSMALGLIVLTVIAGAPLLYPTRRYLDRLTALAETDAAAAIAGFKTWVVPQLLAVAALGALVGWWTIREGIRAYRAERFPRRDMWVIHDTPVRRGRDARAIGVWLVMAGIAVAAMPALVVVLLLAILFRYQ